MCLVGDLGEKEYIKRKMWEGIWRIETIESKSLGVGVGGRRGVAKDCQNFARVLPMWGKECGKKGKC
jgi:hypothetical protein